MEENINITKKNFEKLEDNLTIPKELYDKFNNLTFEMSNLDNYIKFFYSDELSVKYYGLIGIRKLFCLVENNNNNNFIQKLIDIQLVPKLINILMNCPNELIYNSLWCLTNICIGTTEQSMNIILNGGIDKIMFCMMNSNIEEIVIQSIWIFGNLSCDSKKVRDILFTKDIFNKILDILLSTNNINIIKQGIWAISNFLRGPNPPIYEKVKRAFDIITKILYDSNYEDEEILKNGYFIITRFTYKSPYNLDINNLFKVDLIPKIINLLDINNTDIKKLSLSILEDLSLGNNELVQKLLDNNVLDKLKQIYEGDNKNDLLIQKASLFISNIACGNDQQKEELINKNYLSILINLYKENSNFKVKKESLFGIGNMIIYLIESEKYINMLINQEDLFKIIKDNLESDDPECKSISKQLKNMFLDLDKKYPEKNNVFSKKLE